jgi:protein gp37
MNRTKISWCDWTWSPVTGCTPISDGCRSCYAKRLAETRLRGRCGYPADEPFRVTLHPERLTEPFNLGKPSRIFPVSMGDLFHPDVPDQFIRQVFTVMVASHQHQFFVLTKRPERMLALCQQYPAWRSDHILLGATIESQDYIARAEMLVELAQLGWHTFVSAEPLLGPLDMATHLAWIPSRERADYPLAESPIPGIEFMIVAGETGPDARPMRLEWAQALLNQCRAAGIPFHFKYEGDHFWKNLPPEGLPTQAVSDVKEFPQWT